MACPFAPPLPKLSIGLPVYNGERFLPESLDHLLGQTYSDFEIVIDDNASTDRTSQIYREYALHDPRIRYFQRTTALGYVWRRENDVSPDSSRARSPRAEGAELPASSEQGRWDHYASSHPTIDQRLPR